MQLFLIIFAAIIIEGLVTYIQTFFTPGTKFQWQQLVTVLVGLVVALAYNVDIFALFGITAAIPFIGCILTGILMSRGSNYIFDLINKLTTAKGSNT